MKRSQKLDFFELQKSYIATATTINRNVSDPYTRIKRKKHAVKSLVSGQKVMTK